MAVTTYTARGAYLGAGTTTITDALFRSWGTMMSSALSGIGLVQTSDTGQINWSTATWPGTNTTAAGYEVWRFDDSLQSSAPIFMKIEYGRGVVNTGSVFMFRVSVASGSNGSGTLTGAATISAYALYFGAWSASVFAVGDPDDSAYGINIAYANITGNHTFMIERTRDADTLVANTNGVVVYSFTPIGSSGSFSGVYSVAAIDFNTTEVAQFAQPTLNFVPATGAWTASGTTVVQQNYFGVSGELSPMINSVAFASGALSTGGRYSIVGRDSKTRIYLNNSNRLNRIG